MSARRGLVALLCAGAASAAAGAGVPARWQCAPTGASVLVPALAEAARDYLARVETLYPHQILGLVRAGDRFYLLNSIDIEWGDRTRLNLLALRLRESYLTAERQATGATPGSSPPPGGFVCLAAARAEREGLARTSLGEIVLSAGHTVHLVDPQEPSVAVEVRAAKDRSLNLAEILYRSARTGIYAGLTAQAGQQVAAATIETPDATLIVRMVASAAESVRETRIDVPVPPAVAPVEIAAAPGPGDIAVRAEEPSQPAVVAVIPETTASPAVPPGRSSAPAASVPEARAPVVIPARVIPAFAGQQVASGQSYDDYARAMKKLLALRRSGAVQSVSELTYVHPAVEVLRAKNR